MLEALKGNGTVGIFVDQNSQLDQGVFVDFFGAGPSHELCQLAHGRHCISALPLHLEAERRYRLKFNRRWI